MFTQDLVSWNGHVSGLPPALEELHVLLHSVVGMKLRHKSLSSLLSIEFVQCVHNILGVYLA